MSRARYDGVNRDAPADPPTLATNGDLIGETYGRIYGYHAGKISTIFTFTAQTNMAGGPLLLGPHAMIYGAGEQGGQIPCTLIDGEQQFNGCGSVFAYPITP